MRERRRHHRRIADASGLEDGHTLDARVVNRGVDRAERPLARWRRRRAGGDQALSVSKRHRRLKRQMLGLYANHDENIYGTGDFVHAAGASRGALAMPQSPSPTMFAATDSYAERGADTLALVARLLIGWLFLD